MASAKPQAVRECRKHCACNLGLIMHGSREDAQTDFIAIPHDCFNACNMPRIGTELCTEASFTHKLSKAHLRYVVLSSRSANTPLLR